MIHCTACMFWTKKGPLCSRQDQRKFAHSIEGWQQACKYKPCQHSIRKIPKASSYGAPDRKTTGRGIFKMWSWGLLWEFCCVSWEWLTRRGERKRWVQRWRLWGTKMMELFVRKLLNLVYTCHWRSEIEGFRKPRVGGSIWAPLRTKCPPIPPTFDSRAPNANYFHYLFEFYFCLLFCFIKDTKPSTLHGCSFFVIIKIKIMLIMYNYMLCN